MTGAKVGRQLVNRLVDAGVNKHDSLAGSACRDASVSSERGGAPGVIVFRLKLARRAHSIMW